MNTENLTAYEIIREKDMPELDAKGTLLRHKKSGARIFAVENSDENKVFSIGFRTPPYDSTGLPHIMEHSVLCGSRKFPAKDPFVELAKGSLNTFLNAMTYPDKTVYPIASCNDKDFQNLMDVYLDAVFYPNIYKNEKIFRQEGWHYEMASPDDDLTINGVVYNEMKGVFSSPESLIERNVQGLLFPDTPYHHESGGDPDVIPQLTYEAFLDFHRKYYHPSNSYIYLYGDMDMEEKLNWLDEAYLAAFEADQVDSAIPLQASFDGLRETVLSYPVTDPEEEQEGTYLSLTYVTGTSLSPELYLAFQVLNYCLLGSPGALLRRALLDAGIGKDIMGGYDNGFLQPYFTVAAKETEEEKKDEFLSVIRGTFESIVKNGLDKNSLRAGLNQIEFQYREADYGSAPKGLIWGLQSMDSWLYADDDPFMHLCYSDTLDAIRAKIDTDYFERLVEEYFLDNPHQGLIIARPVCGLAAEREAKLAEKLAAYKASLSEEEVAGIVESTAALKAYQSEPTPQEDLLKIPLLSREDIGTEPAPLFNEEKSVGGITVLHHELFTAGIGYLRLLFDMNGLPQRLLPAAGLLASVFGAVDTDAHTYSELADLVNLNTGGISFSINTYEDYHRPESGFSAKFTVQARALYPKTGAALDLIREMLTGSALNDEKRLSEILGELISRMEMGFMEAGHSTAVSRGKAYFSESSAFMDTVRGLVFYQYADDLLTNFEEKKAALCADLAEVCRLLFTPERLLVSFTADADGYAQMAELLPAFTEGLFPAGENCAQAWKWDLTRRNEGLTTPGMVQYVARCGQFDPAELPYTGALDVLRTILSYDYLWTEIRVKGGAYGCMNGFGRNGEGYFVSYRDPNLGKTNDVYQAIPDYLAKFTPDERDMTKYVIGTVSRLDTPLTPSGKGGRSLGAWLCGTTIDELRRERAQIIGAQAEDIRALIPYVRAVLDSDILVVVGGESAVNEEKELFGEIHSLLHE